MSFVILLNSRGQLRQLANQVWAIKARVIAIFPTGNLIIVRFFLNKSDEQIVSGIQHKNAITD